MAGIILQPRKFYDMEWKIGIFGGFAVTCIVYFMLLKGIKTMSFMNADIKHWIADNTLNILQESESMTITLMRLTRSSRKFQLG